VQKWGVGMDNEREWIGGGFGASRRLVERRGRVGVVEDDDDDHYHDDDKDAPPQWDASREAGGVWKRRRRQRATTISASKSRRTIDNPQYHPIDPLHLPSLIALSLSLFAPLKERVWSVLSSTMESLKEGKVQVALIGGFCVGVGVGLWAGAW